MKKICITGGIACGKSLVGDYWREAGASVIDADDICHMMMRAGSPLTKKIVAAFGNKILDRDGGIDRRVLGRIVFDEPSLRLRLNAIVHPEVREAINLWLKSLETTKNRGQPARIAAAMVPLVFEAGWDEDWDAIVCVAAPYSIQIERLRRRGFSCKEAAARVAAQMPLVEKMSRSDYVIFNAGPIAGLRSQAALVFRNIKQGALL